MAEDIKLTIGIAEVTVDGTKVPNMADAATFSAEPIFQEVDLYTAPNYDRIIEGWNVSLTIVVDEESYEGYKLALAGVNELVDSVDGETVTGLTDSPGLKSLRNEAKEIIIHPANAPDNSFDITIFKAVPTGTFERSYSKEKTSYEIQFTALHKTGDYTQPSNYFLIGEDLTV